MAQVTYNVSGLVWSNNLHDPTLEDTDLVLNTDVPQFDPALGTLRAVLTRLYGDVDRDHRVENLDPVNLQIVVDNGVGNPSPGMLYEVNLQVDPSGVGSGDVEMFTKDLRVEGNQQNVTAFDGTLDYAGSSAIAVANGLLNYNEKGNIISDVADLLKFQGSGNITLRLEREDNYAVEFVASGISSGSWDTNTDHNTNLSVQYLY